MTDYISDRISDYLADQGRTLFTPHLRGEDRLVPNEKSTFDATVVAGEILAFDAEAAATYRDAGLSRVEHGTDADVVYDVLPDGRWHVNQHQLFLMLAGQPHLTPTEWVERDVAQRLLKAVKFIRNVEEAELLIKQLWQCELGYVLVVFSWTTDYSRSSRGLDPDYWALRIYTSNEAGSTVGSTKLTEGGGYSPWNHEEMHEVIARLKSGADD
jgi:hypothetical protein